MPEGQRQHPRHRRPAPRAQACAVSHRGQADVLMPIQLFHAPLRSHEHTMLGMQSCS